jgi:N-acetylneuraminic acid mutarotase
MLLTRTNHRLVRVVIVSSIIVSSPWLAASGQATLVSLPVPLSNNAVASLKAGKRQLLFSFMGIGSKKTWNAITNSAYSLELGSDHWIELHPVPGPAGRIAASAVGVRDQVVLLGGYTVDSQGGEITVRDVSVYSPPNHRWFRGTDLPIPIDDAVAVAYRDRYVYVIGGWTGRDAVTSVQVYDVQKNRWEQATAVPGMPVFGHAGALLDDTIVYVDGARKNPSGSPRYLASDECWMGKIDHKNVTKIQWTRLPEHPGAARYRIAAGASEKDHRIYFTGGTNNPYNYNGIDYDGQPAEPVSTTFDFDLKSGQWETVTDDTPDPIMDHSGLLPTHDGMVIIGGMEKGQQVTAKVRVIPRKAQ